MNPLGEGESVSKNVAKSLDVIDQSGLDYQLTAMGTILEGEWDEVMGVVKQCYEKMSEDCDRISCYLKVDARKGRSNRIHGKVNKLESVLDRKLKK